MATVIKVVSETEVKVQYFEASDGEHIEFVLVFIILLKNCSFYLYICSNILNWINFFFYKLPKC